MPDNKEDGKRVFTGIYFDRRDHDMLRKLSKRTMVPVAAYIREAVKIVLKKNAKKLKTKKRRKR